MKAHLTTNNTIEKRPYEVSCRGSVCMTIWAKDLDSAVKDARDNLNGAGEKFAYAVRGLIPIDEYGTCETDYFWISPSKAPVESNAR